jgi:kynurenine formamidase
VRIFWWRSKPPAKRGAINPDYVLNLDDIAAWESRHGIVPKGAFVAMRTDWSRRWPDDAKLANLDQVPEAGAVVRVSFPKVLDGSGFPARVIAVVP